MKINQIKAKLQISKSTYKTFKEALATILTKKITVEPV